MAGIATHAHAVVLVGDAVLLIHHVERGRPVHEAPGVVARPGETPGQAAERAARERLGLEVTARDLLFADTEHGAEHYFFLAEPADVDALEWRQWDPEVRPIRLAALLAYQISPRGLALSLARHR